MNEGPTSGILYLSSESQDAALSRLPISEVNQIYADQRRDFPPPNQEATLWKYLDTYKFEDLLEKKGLYLRQVEKLAEDEPNEGRMNQLQEKAMVERLGNTEVDLENFRAFHAHVRQNSWVTCFSLGDFDEIHMWERFCKKAPNEGVAIKTTYKKLMSSFKNPAANLELIPACAMVRDRELSHMQWKHGYLLFQKVPEFSDEREVRACVISLEEKNPKDCLRVPVSLPELIQKIFVHPKASEAYMKRVCELAAENLPKNEWRVCWSRFR
jgi:hypothetical protein